MGAGANLIDFISEKMIAVPRPLDKKSIGAEGLHL